MKNKLTGFIVALFTMLAFNSAKAQCASIDNTFGCDITVAITYYTNCGGTQVLCNTMPQVLTFLAGSGVTPLPCNQCNGGTVVPCDVRVVVTKVNGIPISSSIQATFATVIPVSGTTSCGTLNLVYASGVFTAY